MSEISTASLERKALAALELLGTALEPWSAGVRQQSGRGGDGADRHHLLASAADRHVQHRYRAAARGNLRAAGTSAASLWSGHPSAAPGGARERLAAPQGANGLYQSIEVPLECCRVRKAEPFARGIAGFRAWITGVRRAQSQERAGSEPLVFDHEQGLYKISPLLEWTEAEVWQYNRAHRLPYNALHDRQFPSIGCSPCTRAVEPGESRRAGRWWWEQPESRECGLQMKVPLLRQPRAPVHA